MPKTMARMIMAFYQLKNEEKNENKKVKKKQNIKGKENETW